MIACSDASAGLTETVGGGAVRFGLGDFCMLLPRWFDETDGDVVGSLYISARGIANLSDFVEFAGSFSERVLREMWNGVVFTIVDCRCGDLGNVGVGALWWCGFDSHHDECQVL